MKTLEIRTGNPTEQELVAITMALEIHLRQSTSQDSPTPESSHWALSAPLQTQRRELLNAPGSAWQRSGHLGTLW